MASGKNASERRQAFIGGVEEKATLRGTWLYIPTVKML
jgi:hypothetical protein